MILDEVLKAQWSPYGIRCNSVEETKKLHKFLREAVLDRHICLHKVIGFQIASNVAYRSYVGTYIARHMQIGESYPQIVVNMLDKVFIGIDRDIAKCLLTSGMNTLENNKFSNGRTVDYNVLYTNPDICRCLSGSTYFNVKLAYDSGYRSMHENSKALADNYFPCYTDYSLADYVRVLPISSDATLIPIRYYNGMTPDIFLSILQEWRAYIGTGGLRKEDALWLQHGYTH